MENLSVKKGKQRKAGVVQLKALDMLGIISWVLRLR